MSKSKAKIPKRVKNIPIDKIRFLNPRVRNRRNFQEIVQSIANVGLKRPITVSPRKSDDDSASYDLVCGQGRIEAFIQLGQTEIPAIVIEVKRLPGDEPGRKLRSSTTSSHRSFTRHQHPTRPWV
jgi:ParB family transcriptional regulator, chromosome partitioning protein